MILQPQSRCRILNRVLSTTVFRSDRRAADNLLKQLRNKEQQPSPSATAVSGIGRRRRQQVSAQDKATRSATIGVGRWVVLERGEVGGGLHCLCRSLSAGITLKHLRCCTCRADVTYVRAVRTPRSSWRATWPPSSHLPSSPIIAP